MLLFLGTQHSKCTYIVSARDDREIMSCISYYFSVNVAELKTAPTISAMVVLSKNASYVAKNICPILNGGSTKKSSILTDLC